MAASITSQEIHVFSSAQKDEGRSILAEALGWKVDDEEVEMRKSILLDYLYDHCKFAVDKGFSLKQINAVIQFAEELLEETKSLTVPKALLTFKSKSDFLAPILGERNFKIYSEFLFSTYMRHFQLFQLVFTTDRTTDFVSYTEEIEIPPEPNAFKDGKDVKIWEYEQKIKEMEKKERELSNEQCERKSKLIEETEQLKSKVLSDNVGVENQLKKEELEKLVKEVIAQYSDANLKILQASVTDIQESLQIKLEKVSLPRPSDSGHQTKTGNLKGKNPSAVLKESPGKSAKSRK